MKLMKLKLLVVALVLLVANSAFAALSYHVTVDTAAFENTTGYLFFTYIPVNALDSTATVSNFQTDFNRLASTPENAIDEAGGVTGQLPGTLTFRNSGGLNDYTHGITFGRPLSFDLSLANITTGTVSGSSTFSLSLQDSGYTTLATLFTVDLNSDGTATVVAQGADVTPTPIPAAFWLLGSGLMDLAGIRRRS